AVVHLAEPAAPLAVHAAGLLPLLGEGGTVQDEDGLGVAQFGADLAAEFAQDGLVVPAAGADEQLQGAAFLTGLGGDGLGGLALQATELAAQERAGVVA